MSNKILILQKICLRHYPFWPFIWRVCPIGLISKERSLFYKLSGILYRFRKILRCILRGRPITPYGSFSNKMKNADFLRIVLSSFCSSVHFKILVVFEILKVKDLLFWLLRSTNNQINGMMRLWSTNGTMSDF